MLKKLIRGASWKYDAIWAKLFSRGHQYEQQEQEQDGAVK